MCPVPNSVNESGTPAMKAIHGDALRQASVMAIRSLIGLMLLGAFGGSYSRAQGAAAALHESGMSGQTPLPNMLSMSIIETPGALKGSALPAGSLGADDLVEIMVPYCPELSRSFRVSAEGTLELPLLNHPIPVLGLAPSEVSSKIKAALIDQQVLSEPIVTVSVLEYRSRTVSVVGAVARPLTFQAMGQTTLLDAIAMAGGVTPNVGTEIFVSTSHEDSTGTVVRSTQDIPTAELLAKDKPEKNLLLHGGEEIRVSLAANVFVAGNVKKPGVYPIQGTEKITVVKALALSEGLEAFSSHSAYIYRLRAGSPARDEIQVPLRKILTRQAPDVFLQADDILFIPDSSGRRITARALEVIVGFGSSAAAGILIYK